MSRSGSVVTNTSFTWPAIPRASGVEVHGGGGIEIEDQRSGHAAEELATVAAIAALKNRIAAGHDVHCRTVTIDHNRPGGGGATGESGTPIHPSCAECAA